MANDSGANAFRSEGLKLKNPKILADQFAQYLKCDVWVPDVFAGARRLCPDVLFLNLFGGHPPVTESQMKSLPDRAGVKLGFFDILKLILVALPSIPALFVTNRKSVVDGRTTSVCSAS